MPALADEEFWGEKKPGERGKKQHQKWNKISKEELEFALNKSHKWKSHGTDKTPNFWISSLSKALEKIASLLSEIVESSDTAPKWLSKISQIFDPELRTLTIPKTTNLSLA